MLLLWSLQLIADLSNYLGIRANSCTGWKLVQVCGINCNGSRALIITVRQGEYPGQLERFRWKQVLEINALNLAQRMKP